METENHKAILRTLEIKVDDFVNWCGSIRNNITEEKACERASKLSESDSNESIDTLPEGRAKFVVASADEFCSSGDGENEF